MAEICTICNSKMAHYYDYPDDYCITHFNWIDKCASDSCVDKADIKVARLIPEEGFFICPVDGILKEAVVTYLPSAKMHKNNWTEGELPDNHKQVLQHAVKLMETGQVSPQTQESLLSTSAQSNFDFFNKHMEQTQGLQKQKKLDDMAKMFPQSPLRATGALDAKKLIPVLHESYDNDVHKPGANEELKERAKKAETTPENIVAVDKARAEVEKLDGSLAGQYLESIPEHRRFEVVKGLSTSPVNSMNETYHELRDAVGLSAEASIQKEAMWYYLKPRWILRRKAQAVIRNKVRSVIKPVSLKI